jgi:excisionase family DNA binding protein
VPTPPTDAAPRAERLLTLSEAAFRLGRVHRTTVMRWVKEGGLRCVRLSRKAILFEPAELERFIRDHRSSG